jgi:hypothetical protein
MDMYLVAPTIAHLLTLILLKPAPPARVNTKCEGMSWRPKEEIASKDNPWSCNTISIHSHAAIQCTQFSLFLLNTKMNTNIVESKA